MVVVREIGVYPAFSFQMAKIIGPALPAVPGSLLRHRGFISCICNSKIQLGVGLSHFVHSHRSTLV